LNGRRGGVFVECGAGDGEYLSNSLFFELHRDWTGVLVEAEPNRRRALLAKNRHVRVVGACLSTSTSRPQSDLYRLVDVDAPGGMSVTSTSVAIFYVEKKSMKIHLCNIHNSRSVPREKAADSLSVLTPSCFHTVGWTMATTSGLQKSASHSQKFSFDRPGLTWSDLRKAG